MGDRYEMHLDCYSCGHNQEVYYAESSGYTSFKCEQCNLWNDIVMNFEAQKHEHNFDFAGDVCECGKEKRKRK